MATERILHKVIEHIMNHAKYIDDAPLTPYFVRYPNPYTGTFFCAKSTDDLVIQVMKLKHPRASMRGYS